MNSKSVSAFPRATAACAGLLLSLASCTIEPIAAGPFDESGALRSLVQGIGPTGLSSVFGPPVFLLGPLATHLDQMDVTINGVTQHVFGLGLQEIYPPGTCVETLIVSPNPSGTCTPLPYTSALILWQGHDSNLPPDRLALIIGNPGTIDFAATGTNPPLAVYYELGKDIWDSSSGTLTTNVTATTEACTVPIPQFATTGSCAFGTFDVQGTINLVPEHGVLPVTIVIPPTTIHGMVQTITQAKAHL